MYDSPATLSGGGRIRLQTDVIVDCIAETLLAPEVSLRRLDGDVTQQKLNLLQFAAGQMTETGTSTAVMPHAA